MTILIPYISFLEEKVCIKIEGNQQNLKVKISDFFYTDKKVFS